MANMARAQAWQCPIMASYSPWQVTVLISTSCQEGGCALGGWPARPGKASGPMAKGKAIRPQFPKGRGITGAGKEEKSYGTRRIFRHHNSNNAIVIIIFPDTRFGPCWRRAKGIPRQPANNCSSKVPAGAVPKECRRLSWVRANYWIHSSAMCGFPWS